MTIRMLCIACVVILSCLPLASCAGQKENYVVAAAAEAPETQAISPEMAAQLASIHLALKNWTWGEPENIVEREGKYYVYYKTPERELRFVGARIVVVDKDSRVVSVQKRR